MEIHWKIWFFRGEGVHKLEGEVGQFADLMGEGDKTWQKRGGRQGACYDITKFEESQTKKEKK